MCVARNPYRQTNTLLLQVDENLIDAATALQDNIILASRSETLLKEEEECVQTSSYLSSLWNLISLFICICVIPMAIATLQHKSTAQGEDIKAIQMSMQRIRVLRDKQTRSLADLEILTQELNTDF